LWRRWTHRSLLWEKNRPLNFSTTQPDLAGGIHCNLFNNAWGTNYIMWFGENMRFRFILARPEIRLIDFVPTNGAHVEPEACSIRSAHPQIR